MKTHIVQSTGDLNIKTDDFTITASGYLSIVLIICLTAIIITWIVKGGHKHISNAANAVKNRVMKKK